MENTTVDAEMPRAMSSQRFRSRSDSQRSKRWAPKVKTGCITCRARRIKCDEAKPTCSRCLASGRVCAGYDPDPTSAAALAPAPALTRQPSAYMTPFQADSTAEEKYLFHVFRFDTAHRIAGIFDDSLLFLDVTQACHAHPAVWHAALSIASMQVMQRTAQHLPLSRHVSQRYDQIAVYQYDRAVQQLIQAVQSMGSSFEGQSLILLITMLLFTTTSLRGDLKDAKMFAHHVLNLFGKWDFRRRAMAQSTSPDTSSHPVSVRSLVAFVDELYVQYFWAASAVKPPPHVRGLQSSKTPFASLSDAYHELQDLRAHLFEMRFRGWGGQSPSSLWEMRRPDFFRHLSIWTDKFRQLERAKQQYDHSQLASLHMSMMSMRIFSRVDLSDHLSWDSFTPQFRRIVELAEGLVVERQDPSLAPATLAYGIMYMVTSFCRDSAIRNRALNWLRRSRRRDGLLDSRLLALQAETKIDLETRGKDLFRLSPELGECQCTSDGFICRIHRLVDGAVEFLEHGMARLTFLTPGNATISPARHSVIVNWIQRDDS